MLLNPLDAIQDFTGRNADDDMKYSFAQARCGMRASGRRGVFRGNGQPASGSVT